MSRVCIHIECLASEGLENAANLFPPISSNKRQKKPEKKASAALPFWNRLFVSTENYRACKVPGQFQGSRRPTKPNPKFAPSGFLLAPSPPSHITRWIWITHPRPHLSTWYLKKVRPLPTLGRASLISFGFWLCMYIRQAGSIIKLYSATP